MPKHHLLLGLIFEVMHNVRMLLAPLYPRTPRRYRNQFTIIIIIIIIINADSRSKDKTAFITRFINVPLLGASSLVTLIFSSDVQDIFFILKIQNTILSCVFQKVSWKMKY